jgi:ubiquinone/menaquinone biosynthesis C-methylase UbiE
MSDAALREFLRVTKPGGRLVICEFSQPTNKAFRTVYSNYLMRSLPAVARKVSSNPESYVYLAESIQAWPAQRGLAQRVSGAGWARSSGATFLAASSPSTGPPSRPADRGRTSTSRVRSA